MLSKEHSKQNSQSRHCLKPVSYEECIYIVREVEPLDRAYFITRGTAWTYTTTRTNGEATPSSSQSEWLEKGGFFGEELIEWGLDLGQQASSDIFNLPLSTKIFKSHTKVEAYALMATDLKNIVSQINDAASKLHSALRHNKENQKQKGKSYQWELAKFICNTSQ